jgi:L-threonylcarbamoyladenylate synthase
MKIIKLTDSKLPWEFNKTYEDNKLIIFPTETCYGVGANPQSEHAITNLLNYKNRPPGKAISVAVSRPDEINTLIKIQEENKSIVSKFLPGPITVVGNSLGKVDKRLEAPDQSLGVRVPAYPPLLDLLAKTGKIITATSANLSGKANPYSPEQLLKQLSGKKKNQIGLIIDAGELPKNPPSLVIDLRQNFQVYREGLLSKNDILTGQIYNANTESETIKIAQDWLKRFWNKNLSIYREKSLVVLLTGELGAGKTTFTKGLAKGIGIEDNVNSPTFNYVSEYLSNESVLFHADLWRMESENITFKQLGIDIKHERYSGIKSDKKLIVVEWPDKLNLNLLRDNTELVIVEIKIFKTGQNSRRIVITDNQSNQS